jgi:UDP-galactopyranose mutase
MLQDRLILCDANIPWHHNRYSKHHLMSRLARGNEVVFVNPQVDALELVRREGARGLCLGARLEQPEGEELTVFTPLALPRRGELSLLGKADQRYFVRQLRKIIVRYPARDLVLFIGNPWNVFLLDAFPEAACTLYHCSDNFPALFAGGLREKVERRETELIQRADVVVCSHPRLVQKCVAMRDDVCYLEHAVDERFLRPMENFCSNQGPSDMTNIPHPRVGFVGSLDATVNFELLAKVAGDSADLNFVLIGPTDDAHRGPLEALTTLPNVHWLATKPWADLPGYLWNFDVAIIPFAMTNFTAAGSPLKQFEYLAAGLPIVSTRLEFADAIRPHIRIAETPEQFGEQLRDACSEANDSSKARERIRTIETGYTWGIRTEELSQQIVSRIGVSS